MSNRVEASTQADLDRVLKAGDFPILIGDEWFRIDE